MFRVTLADVVALSCRMSPIVLIMVSYLTRCCVVFACPLPNVECCVMNAESCMMNAVSFRCCEYC